jgi:hypothetical protein
MKKILVLLLIIGGLFIYGCTSNGGTQPRGSGGTQMRNCDQQCSAVAGETKTLCYAGCIEEQAGQSGDATLCENIKNRENAEGVNYVACLELAGAKLGNTATCDRIENVSLRDTCYFGLQPKILDPTTCPKLSTPQKQEICRNMRRE